MGDRAGRAPPPCPATAAPSTRDSTSSLTIAPSSSTACASSPSSRSTAAPRSAASSSTVLGRPSVAIPSARDQQVLRRRAHLSTVEAQREGEVGQHAGVVVGGVDDHRVDAGLLGVDLRLPGVVLQPLPERGRPGEVDDPHLRPDARSAATRPPGSSATSVTRLRAKPASASTSRAIDTRDRQRQDRARVRLHHHRVAGGQAGEQPGVGVPGRERVAADHQPDPARHHRVRLLHHQRPPLALRLLPARGRRHPGLLRVRVRRPPPAPGPARAARRPGTPSRTPARWCACTAFAISKLRALIRRHDLHADRGPHLGPASRQAGIPAGAAGSSASRSPAGS